MLRRSNPTRIRRLFACCSREEFIRCKEGVYVKNQPSDTLQRVDVSNPLIHKKLQPGVCGKSMPAAERAALAM